MSAEAHDDQHPSAPLSPSAQVLRIRVTGGDYAGLYGVLWRQRASMVEADLGPDGGWVDLPADWVEVLDD